jgi:hypothetical protein
MSKSFRLDLGNGRRPTAAGWVVILLAAAATACVGITSSQWVHRLIGIEDPFVSFMVALVAGAAVLRLGWGILRAMHIPFSRNLGD